MQRQRIREARWRVFVSAGHDIRTVGRGKELTAMEECVV